MQYIVADTVLMIKPEAFFSNPETAGDNFYQKESQDSKAEVQAAALAEFNGLVSVLEENGIDVIIIEDIADPPTPDSIFPNNWFSTHQHKIWFYHMAAKNRREERRKFQGVVTAIMRARDENIMVFMVNPALGINEGTGSMVMDHSARIIYASLSERCQKTAVSPIAHVLGYDFIYFWSFDRGELIYHTNVMLTITTKFALICLEAIEKGRRDLVRESLEKSNKEIIEISLDQVAKFLGNCLELRNKKDELFLVCSKSAYEAMTPEQKAKIEKSHRIIYSDLSTIEANGGGSARCMLAEIF